MGPFFQHFSDLRVAMKGTKFNLALSPRRLRDKRGVISEKSDAGYTL